MRIPREREEEILERWPVARLATLAADGRPRLVPVVCARAAGRLWSPVDGKPKRGGELARVRDVRRDARVSLLFDHYAEDWTQLWWLRLEGEASLVDAAAPDAACRAGLAALRAKYPQYERVPLLRDPPRVLAVRETRRTSWCPGPEPPEPTGARATVHAP